MAVRKLLSPIRFWVLAALLAAVVTLAGSFDQTGNLDGLLQNKGRALLWFCLRVPLYFALFRLAWQALHAKPRRPLPRWLAKAPALKLGGLLYLCWLPWYICLFPGTVTVDSITQLMMVMGLKPLSAANPICQTGLVGLFRYLGLAIAGSPDLGVALYCVTQSLLMAWLLAETCVEISRSGAPGWLFWGSLAFYGLMPVFPVFAFCVGKDTNFAMAVLWLSLLCWQTVQGRPHPVRLLLAAALCAALRNAGACLAALTLLILLICERKNKKNFRAALWGLAGCAVMTGVIQLIAIPALHAAPSPKTETWSLPLQQVARVAVGDGLTQEEADIVRQVLPLDNIKALYNGQLSDPVKDLWNQNATKEQTHAFFRVWLQVLRREPATCLSATFHNTYGYLTPGFMSQIKPTLIMGDQVGRYASVKGYYDYTVNPLADVLKARLEILRAFAPYRVLVSPGLYGWIALFGLFCLWRKGTRQGLICLTPALFTLAGCFLSAVNGYFRYAMPLYLCAPLVLMAVAWGRSQPIFLRLTKRLNGSILDVGGGGECVMGRIYGGQVLAIDSCQSELDEAPDVCPKRLMDAAQMTFAGDSFDHVTFFFSLMYMDGPTQLAALKQSARVLRPGGSLLIWDAAFDSAYPRPFRVDLSIDANGQPVRTAYGIGKAAGQSRRSVAALCRQAGLVLTAKRQRDGLFFLECRKK